MHWHVSNSCDPKGRLLADRHYNRQKPGSRRFVPPGRCLVLMTKNADALWVTSWPFAEYVRHEWAGAWICCLFRNESSLLSSELIVEAVQCTLAHYGEPPSLGMVTFVNAAKIRSDNPGCCYKKAGFKVCGTTKGGLVALQMLPEDMPEPCAANGTGLPLLDLLSE